MLYLTSSNNFSNGMISYVKFTNIANDYSMAGEEQDSLKTAEFVTGSHGPQSHSRGVRTNRETYLAMSESGKSSEEKKRPSNGT